MTPRVLIGASSSWPVTSFPCAPFDMFLQKDARGDRKSFFITVNPGRLSSDPGASEAED
jgi:hypothetical protein